MLRRICLRRFDRIRARFAALPAARRSALGGRPRPDRSLTGLLTGVPPAEHAWGLVATGAWRREELIRPSPQSAHPAARYVVGTSRRRKLASPATVRTTA